MNHSSRLDSERAKEPIVLLHSSGMSSRQWRRLIATLGPGRRVIAHDFLGSGDNPAWPERQDFSLQLELDALVERWGTGEAAHLVGHSYGAFVALELARLEPSRVASLALFEPTAFGVLEPSDDDDILEAVRELVPLFAPSDVPMRLASLRTLSGAIESPLEKPKIPLGSEAWLRAFTTYWAGEGVWDAMPATTRASFTRAVYKIYVEMRATTLDQTPRAAYRDIAVPTLLMVGERSPETTRRIAKRLAETLRHARLHEFPATGHLGPITHARSVNEVIEAHLVASARGPA